MYYLFFTLLILAPLPICYVLHSTIQQHETKLHASLPAVFNIKLSGLLLVYLLVLIVDSLVVYPDLLNLKLNGYAQWWAYKLDIDAMDVHKKGELRIASGPGDIIYVNQVLGLNNERNILFALDTGTNQPYVAYGPYDYKKMHLVVYPLSSISSDKPERDKGTIVLTRCWPFYLLLTISLLPAFIFHLLQMISPVLAVVDIDLQTDQVASNKPLTIKLGGTIFMYLMMVFVIYVNNNQSLPHTLHHEEQQAMETCEYHSGPYFFSVSVLQAREYVTAYAGNLIINCYRQSADMRVDGFYNPIHVKDPYQVRHPMGVDIQVNLMGFDRERLYALIELGMSPRSYVYAAGVFNRNANEQILHFYDLSNTPDYYTPYSSGQIRLYRSVPTADKQGEQNE